LVTGIVLFATGPGSVAGRQPAVRIIEVQPAPYEVASIRPNTTGRQLGIGGGYHGRFARSNVTLRQLPQAIFEVRPYLVVGGPEWAALTGNFDIDLWWTRRHVRAATV